jgi:uncharacterized protein (TIGR03437 family)
MKQWMSDVPVDFVLHDQIGSRPWLKDFHPAVPDPLNYSDAWLKFTRTYQNRNLMTEDGWDRLAETEVGFTGSSLTGTSSYDPANIRWGKDSRANNQFGAGLWEPYPLGTYLFHDKVMLYHHDLDRGQMDAGAEVLTWNALFGVMAAYPWPEDFYTPAHPDWRAIASAFQPSVLSKLAGKALTSYQQLKSDVYESRFGQITTIANWMPTQVYSVGGFTIAPSGCLVRSDDASIIAGIFRDQFNGRTLSAGTHYLIVETLGSSIEVRQPSGPDTNLTISLPSFWILSAGIQVKAVGSDGKTLGTTQVSLNARQATFTYLSTVSGTRVDHYELMANSTSSVVITSVRTAYGSPDIAQNTWIEIHGKGLAPGNVPATGLTWSAAPDFAMGKMPTQLGGVSVMVNGKAAFVYYVSNTQLNVLTPLDNAVGPIQIVVSNGVNSSEPTTAQMRAAAPSFPLLGATSYVVATHGNATLIGPTSLYPGATSPARPGETIVLYGFGFGLPTSAIVNGSSSQSGMLPVQPVVKIGGLQAALTFAGVIGPGLYQINLVVPATVADGDNALGVSYNGFTSPAGNLIFVQR